jgi:DNA-binding transcriptional MerR regulator
MEKKKRYPIGYVAARCGLTPHVIRAWERRHNAVEPFRTPTNRRLYSDDDIKRLQLLKAATEAGNSIAQIAKLDDTELIETARTTDISFPDTSTAMPALESRPDAYFEACLSAVMVHDAQALDSALDRAAVALPEIALLKDIIVPLIDKIEQTRTEGLLKLFGEHMAMSVIRLFLGDMLRSAEVTPQAPKIIVATPTGQMQEHGVLIISAVAMTMGWQPVLLGTSLPAQEISAAIAHTSARLAALSIVHPPNDPRVNRELLKLSRLIDIPLIVGGRAAPSYAGTLEKIKAIVFDDIPELSRRLTSFLAIQF